MNNTSSLFDKTTSIIAILGMVIVTMVAFPAGAYTDTVEIVGATVIPGTLDIATATDVIVSFTTPVTIPSDGKIVVIFPVQFGLVGIAGISSTDIDGGFSHSLVNFKEVHIQRISNGDPTLALEEIDDLTILNVVTPPIEDYVGDYTVQVIDAEGNILASGTAQGQTFEDVTNLPAEPLSLTVISPNGGEVFTGGNDETVAWNATGGMPFASVYFSEDGGISYDVVVEMISTASHLWTVPNLDVPKGKVKVELIDENGSVILEDISDGNFTILHTQEVVENDGVETVIPHNTLIKGTSFPAVYFFATDMKRYVFPNENVFYSWYSGFDSVIEIDDDVLASFKLGKRVRMAPGSLIKIKSDPKVYAIDSDGNKRHVENEEVARVMFGSDWATRVRDIDITQWFDYPTGEQLNLSDQYSKVVPEFPIMP